jgi:hypothetical protein
LVWGALGVFGTQSAYQALVARFAGAAAGEFRAADFVEKTIDVGLA